MIGYLEENVIFMVHPVYPNDLKLILFDLPRKVIWCCVIPVVYFEGTNAPVIEIFTEN